MKNRKFITPVSMECTKEQYERDLKEPLKELGHKENSMDVCGGRYNILYIEKDGISFINDNSFHYLIKKTTVIDHYNPKLFLALAAMTEGDEPIVGEWMYVAKDADDTDCSKGEFIECLEFGTDEYINGIPKKNQFGKEFNRDIYKKATKEELIKHFTKDMKKEQRFPFELDLEGARKIIDVACEDWRSRLRKKWSLLLDKPTILISERYYKTMRAACSEEQHKVLDEVFGKDEKSIEEEMMSYLRSSSSDFAATFEWQNHEVNRGVFDGVRIDFLTKTLLEKFDIKLKE